MKLFFALLVLLPNFAFASSEIVCTGQKDDFGLQIKTTLEKLTPTSVLISYAMIQGTREAIMVSRAKADVSQSGDIFTITGKVETSAGTFENLPTIRYDAAKTALISDGGRDSGIETNCVLK